ncbi:MAG: cysteine peptidase family C39 domain-containing protein, partial [Thermoproteota archaeon]|nr:cysteine peptidase family C39 domain-containing protein [Thermoproteota archaeon]
MVMLLAISESMAQQTTAPTIPGTVNCGVQSVLALTKLRNHAVPVEQQAQLIQAYPQTAVSMADVKRIAHSLGIELMGVKATLEELTKTQCPAIIHLTQPDHFVLMIDGTTDKIRLLEKPQSKVAVVSRNDIER